MATLKNTVINDTGYFRLPSGTTAQRPVSPSNGMMRYNSTFNCAERYVNGWKYIPDIIRAGLVLQLDAGEPTSYPGSGNIWYDISGFNNNGTLYNGVSYNSIGGGSMSFNGNNTYVQIPDSSSLSPVTGITIFSWTRSNAYGNYTIVGKQSAYQNQTIGTNGIENSIYTPSQQWIQPTTGNNILSTSLFNCICNTYDVGDYTHRTYHNGAELSVGDLPYKRPTQENINDSSLPLYIGAWGDGNSEYFNGYISTVLIYNRALTKYEVLQNFSAYRFRYGI